MTSYYDTNLRFTKYNNDVIFYPLLNRDDIDINNHCIKNFANGYINNFISLDNAN